MNNADVSIVIPTINRPRFLKEAVLSALEQTLPPLEIIIVNDGSDASLVPEINELKRLSPSIRIFNFSENRGAALSRNFGLAQARGEFIQFLDDDDLIHPDMLKAGLEAFQNDSNLGAVICMCDLIAAPSGIESREGASGIESTYAYREYPHPMMLMDQTRLTVDPFSEILLHWPMIPAFLMRRSVIGNTRFPEDLRYGEDMAFWLQIAAQNVRFQLIPSALVHIRKHAGNISRKSQRTDGLIELHQRLLDSGLLQKRHHTFITYARLFLKFLEKRSLVCLKYLGLMLAYPDLFIKYSWMYWLTWPRHSQD